MIVDPSHTHRGLEPVQGLPFDLPNVYSDTVSITR